MVFRLVEKIGGLVVSIQYSSYRKYVHYQLIFGIAKRLGWVECRDVQRAAADGHPDSRPYEYSKVKNKKQPTLRTVIAYASSLC
jgi:hypothetical protein